MNNISQHAAYIILCCCACNGNTIIDSDSESDPTDTDAIIEDFLDSSTDEVETDPSPDIAGDTATDMEEECIFNDNPINFTLLGYGCERLGEIEEGAWIEKSVEEANITHISDNSIEINHYIEGPMEIEFGGISRSDIEHNLSVTDIVSVRTLIYNGGKCIRGVTITKTCGLSRSLVLIFRSGDINNPYYPAQDNVDFSSNMPYQIEEEDETCTITTTIEGCIVDSVSNLIFENINGEVTTLQQGEQSLLSSDSASSDSRKIINNFSYHTAECGGMKTSYFIQMIEPPYTCSF
jgi:hypothetical protein